MRAFIALGFCAALSACSLTPETISTAVAEHQMFPTLSQQVAECLAEHPEVRAEAVAPWNRLVDKWAAADDLEPDISLVAQVADSPKMVAEAERDWIFIRTLITDAGIDCGPAVAARVASIEKTFGEIKRAVVSNQRVVYGFQWAQFLSNVLISRDAKVERLPELPA